MSGHREREGEHVVLGITVRTLGAWPAGWRYPGAHRDPRDDAAALRRIALEAEGAKLDFLFFGEWLATGADFQYSNPYLLARVEPFAAVAFIAAITERIGLIATANTAHSEPYAIARAAASVDLLSSGRVGVNLATGAEVRSARNFGEREPASPADRLAAAAEYIEILRGLWDGWDEGAIIADASSGTLVDAERIHRLDFVGKYHSSTGPLNSVRPPQGQVPLMFAGSSLEARRIGAAHADLMLFSPSTLEDAIQKYAEVKGQVEAEGRHPADVKLVTPILPIVAGTRDAAWQVYDELVALVQVDTEATPDLPANRSARSLAGVLGAPFASHQLDTAVPSRVVSRFSDLGRRLVQTVTERSGRTVGGDRPVTYRHLLVAHAVVAPLIVGSAADIADHIESWFRAGGVDGFTVLTPFVSERPDAFTSLVVPELRRRGLFRDDYDGSTLRDHLKLPHPASVHPPQQQRTSQEDPCHRN